MITVLAMMGVLWGIGAAMGTPRRARMVMVCVLMAGVIFIQVALPDGHPLREATGGDVRLWVLLLAFVAIGYAYRAGLRRVKTMAVATHAKPVKTGAFESDELDRYARHIMLREVGGPGQKALKNARVLVVGAGGLGAPALQYLAAAGVGTIGVIDDDVVDTTNLQRQVIHTTAQIGRPKVHSAVDAMAALNPHVTLRPYHRKFTSDIAAELLADYDLVLDGTDNFETRFAVNLACAVAGKPLIAGALTQWEGQMSLYDPARGAPCFACIFPNAPDPVLVPNCAEAGVIGPLPGVIGAMMALEAVKEITGAGEGLRGKLLIYDALYVQTRVISASRRDDCEICAGRHAPA